MFDLGSRFKTMFETIAKRNLSMRIKPKNCSVSTMTISGKLDSPVDIDSIVQTMQTSVDFYGLSMADANDSPAKRAKAAPSKAFFNQLTVKSDSTSIKIFSNGAVHVTGARNLVHFLDIIDRVCTALGSLMTTQPLLESASISMINATFGARRLLPLQIMRQAFENAGHAASYDPETYPGINAKILVSEKVVTVLVFTTGNVIISGAKTPEHVSDVYCVVCAIINSLPTPKEQMKKAATNVSNLDNYKIIDGYSSKLVNLCIDGE